MENLTQQIENLYSQMLDLNNRYSQEIISFFKANKVDETCVNVSIDGYPYFQISVNDTDGKNWANLSVNYSDRKAENIALSVNWSGCGMTSVDNPCGQNYINVINALMFNNNMLVYKLKVYVAKFKELEQQVQPLKHKFLQLENEKKEAEQIKLVTEFVDRFNSKQPNGIILLKRKNYNRHYISIFIIKKITENSIFFIEANMDLDLTDKQHISHSLEVCRNKKTSLKSFVSNELCEYDIIEI